MPIFILVFEDRTKVEPAVEPFVLIFRINKVEEVFFFKVSEFNMAQIMVCEMYNFLKFIMLIELFIIFHLNVNFGWYHDITNIFRILSSSPIVSALLTWAIALLATVNRGSLTDATVYLFLFDRHLAECWWFPWGGASTSSFVVLLQKVPFLLTKLALYLLNYFLQRDPSTLRWIPFEVLNEVLVSTQWEDVPKNDFEILLIMLCGVRLAIFSVEVIHNISLLNWSHITRVDMDTLAWGPVNYLLNLKKQFVLSVFRIIREFGRKINHVIDQLIHRGIFRQEYD